MLQDPSQLSQALRQRAEQYEGAHFTTSTESHGSFVSAPASTFTVPPHPLLGAVPQLLPAQPKHALSPRRVAAHISRPHRNVKPGFAKHNSAPLSSAPMDAVIAPKMHHSFAGMDAPGDTQPDSQMHREWTSGIFGTAETTTRMPSPRTGPRSLFTEHEDEDDDDDAEPLTDGLEVIVSSQGVQDAAITSPTALEDDCGLDSQTENAFTSPLKFETPVLGGRKRNSSGQVLSDNAGIETTPTTVASASAFGGVFGGSMIGQPLSLTQAFDLTQARTSPVIAGTEDPIFQRPSPNFTNVRHSSPIPALSSPIKVMRNERSDPIIRSSSEPRSEYVTMKESQERRQHSREAQHAPLVRDDSWEELSAAQKRLQRQRQREQKHREAGLSLSSISVPTNVEPRRRRKSRRELTKTQYERSQHQWHDGVQEDEDTMHGPSQQLAPEGDEAEQSPDEPSQDVAVTEQAPMRYNGLDVQVPKTSSYPQRTQPDRGSGTGSQQQGTPSSQLQRESQIQAPASQSILRSAPHSSRGSVAVMDSQPDITANFESWARPATRFPSSPSINQYSINQTVVASRTGYTSQMISSSIQMPPKMTQDARGDPVEEETPEEEEERVPSSPPMLPAETDEITYDEHAHDDLTENDEERDVNETATDNDDVQMEEEEELPVAEPDDIGNIQRDTVQPNGAEVEADEASEVIQPMKVDGETDQEIPETLEDDKRYQTVQDGSTVSRKGSKHEAPEKQEKTMASLERQNTIPDTDALEETQPSWFVEQAFGHQGNTLPVETAAPEMEATEDTNGAEPYSTAQEQQRASRSHTAAPASSRDEGSDPVHDVSRIRSLNDIANLPNTQRSATEEEIELPRLSGFADADGDTHMGGSAPATPAAKRRKTALVARKTLESPAKEAAAAENVQKQVPLLPLKQKQQMHEETSPTASAQEREDQGAAAAAQAREEAQAVAYGQLATLKSRGSSRPARPQNSKKGSLKSARAVIATMSSPLNSPSKPKEFAIAQKPTPATPTRKIKKSVDKTADVEMREAGDSTDELASSPPAPVAHLPVRLTPRKAEIPLEAVVVPNRVFASWPGSHYYPATCIGRSDSKQLHIRFDDGNTTLLDAFQVRALDLKAGDQVKVDEPGMKKHTYVVISLTNKCEDLHNYEFPMTDRHGHVSVILEEKQRDSLPAGKAVLQPKQVTVHIASIYITTQLWSRLRDRNFLLSPPSSPRKAPSELGTPVPTEVFTTPSFTRRGLAAPSLLKEATNRAGSVASSSRSGSGTFSNMAFVLTSTGDGMDKDAIARAIKTNGGRVLEQGFHELFDTESIELTASQSRRTSISALEGVSTLILREEFKKLGFVALITDSHSRSTKYLQALALNVPCLHLRWVNDSLSATHALSFARYLLPAGLSKYLDPNGIVRSRAMRIYDPSSDDVLFDKTIHDRDLLLRDQSVLLVTGKSKKEIEKRQPFVFLTHALGASNVGRCADLAAATHLLAQGQWDWVFVDSDQSSIADAAAELFGTSAPAKSTKGSFKKTKKRKRDDGEAEELLAKGEVAGRRVRIASAEFVIQSLILGALVDE